MRQIDPVLIRVGRSFRLSTWQMVTKIYLPAMREPIVNGVRLGLGVAVIGTLLAETRLSNRGLGFLIMVRSKAAGGCGIPHALERAAKRLRAIWLELVRP